MPSQLELPSWGCLVALILYLAVFAILFWRTRWWLWALFGFPAAVALATVLTREIKGLLLLAECRRTLTPRGVRFLVVYSASPNWEQRIREQWLPRFGAEAVVLNWTDRAKWQRSLEVRLFNHLIKSWHNFNPAVLVLRGFRRPLVFRFYYAFRETKAGRSSYLDQLESELFEHVRASVTAP